MTGGLIGLALGFLGSMPLAGPIAVLVVAKSLHEKYHEAFALALGASLAEPIYCALALFGFDFLFTRYVFLLPASRVLGAIVLTGLGCMFLFSRQKFPDPKNEPNLAQEPGKQNETESLLKNLILGFSISAVNPVLILTWSATVATVYSILGKEFVLLDKIFFPIFAGLGMVLWFFILIWLIRKYQNHLKAQYVDWVIRFMGIGLIAGGLFLSAKFI